MRVLIKIALILLLIAFVLIGLLTFGIRATASNDDKSSLMIVKTVEASHFGECAPQFL